MTRPDAGAGQQQPDAQQHDQRHQHHEAAGGRERRAHHAHRGIGGAAQVSAAPLPQQAQALGRMVDQRKGWALQDAVGG